MAAWFGPLKEASARWIWVREDAPGAARERTETGLFCMTLSPPEATRTIELHVSAEGRYTLWVNDEADPLGHGPARTDRLHRSVDTYSLEAGATEAVQVWAQVRHFAGTPEAPIAEMHGPSGGLLLVALYLDEAGRVLGRVGSSEQVRAARCEAFSNSPITIWSYFAVGGLEQQKSSGFPEGWRGKEAPAGASWKPAAEKDRPYFKFDPEVPVGGNDWPWLIRREIAATEYRSCPIRHVRVMKSTGSRPELAADSVANVRLAPNESVTLRCDPGEQVLAYYRARLSGKGTTLAITAAEVLKDGGDGERPKSFDIDSDLPLMPFTDSFTLDTHAPHTFELSHWRALRFLELTLTAGPEGGVLESFTLHATGYPFEPDYAFDAAARGGADAGVQETVQKMVDISWRTLKCCTWETYMDCPYYEQLQYVGDTRIQCLITYLTTGDPTLPAQALRAFDRSRIHEGLAHSRYPSSSMQLIPTFALIYILMLEDYHQHVGDDALVAELRPGIAPILNWFTQFTDQETGLIQYVPYWPFVDWVKGWDKGMPPHGPIDGPKFSGTSAAVNLHYLLALQAASNIYEHTKAGSGNFYSTRASALKQRIYDTFFDAGRGLVCDIPAEIGRGKRGVWSQHAQALAVLANLLSPTEARTAMTTALDVKNVLRPTEATNDAEAAKGGKFDSRFIAPASFYFLFYVAEALAKLRMGEHFWPLLAPFRDAIARGSTTWPEAFEPARSECHAWSAWPLYFFARHILGIAPPSREDGRIRIRPLYCPPLTSAKGQFQTHRGPVNVNVSWENDKRTLEAKGHGVEVMAE